MHNLIHLCKFQLWILTFNFFKLLTYKGCVYIRGLVGFLLLFFFDFTSITSMIRFYRITSIYGFYTWSGSRLRINILRFIFFNLILHIIIIWNIKVSIILQLLIEIRIIFFRFGMIGNLFSLLIYTFQTVFHLLCKHLHHLRHHLRY